MYPDILIKTIESFKKFSGIGEKTAERLSMSILDMSEEDVSNFSLCINNLKKGIHRCSNCGHITDKKVCDICSNNFRKDNLICVVEDFKSVFMFEKTGNFDGKYHVLNGLISPIDGITPDELNIDSLIKRISNIEGEATTLYLKKILEKYNIKTTRLSYGIPMGVEIDYLDSITLDRALQDRKDI